MMVLCFYMLDDGFGAAGGNGKYARHCRAKEVGAE